MQKPNPITHPFKKFGQQWPKWDRIEKILEESEASRENHRKQANENQSVGIGLDHMPIDIRKKIKME